jgi:hypothetical protein
VSAETISTLALLIQQKKLHLKQSRRDDRRAGGETFVDGSSQKQEATHNEQCNGLRGRPCHRTYLGIGYWKSRGSRTTRFTEVEPDEKANNARNEEAETKEIKLCNMFTEGSSLMRIEVEEEEQNRCRNAASRQVYPETPRKPELVYNMVWISSSRPSPGDMIGKYLYGNQDDRLKEFMKHTPPSKGPMTLAIPQVAPTKPPYLPRLWED